MFDADPCIVMSERTQTNTLTHPGMHIQFGFSAISVPQKVDRQLAAWNTNRAIGRREYSQTTRIARKEIDEAHRPMKGLKHLHENSV